MTGRDDDLHQLRTVVRSFLAEAAPEESTRRLMSDDAGVDGQLWQRMARELGLLGLNLPERFGGAGGGPAEVAVVMEEMGRAVACSPFLATACAAVPLLLRLGDDGAAADYLPAVASGDLILTLCGAGLGTTHAGEGLSLRRDGELYRVSGTVELVLDAMAADVLLVALPHAAGTSMVAVEASSAGVRREPVRLLDQARKAARVDLDGAPARLIGVPGEAARHVAAARDHALVAVAHELLGGMERCLEMAVEYARVREQFGKPIGSFQAVKHRCADMVLQVEAARQAAVWGLWGLRHGSPEEAALASALASAVCGEGAVAVAESAVQVLGGIGYTWEHPAHLYLRRARTGSLVFGTSAAQHGRVAQLLTAS